MFGALCAQSWRHGIFKSSRIVSPRIWCVATLVRRRSFQFLLPFWVETDSLGCLWGGKLQSLAFILRIWWYVTRVNSSVNPQENTIRKKYVDAQNAQMILHFSSCSIQLVAPWLQPRCLKIRKENCSVPPPPASWPMSARSTCIGPSVLLRIMLIHSPDCTYTPPSFFKNSQRMRLIFCCITAATESLVAEGIRVCDSGLHCWLWVREQPVDVLGCMGVWRSEMCREDSPWSPTSSRLQGGTDHRRFPVQCFLVSWLHQFPALHRLCVRMSTPH